MRRPKSIALALALVASVSSFCLADTQPNPYLSVVDRNPFGLKPPPPPPPETPPQPVVPLAKVVLTGVTSVYGPPRAFVEITEQEPGKTPNIKKLMLLAGDREGSIEIISIDVAHNSIRIKNGTIETNVVFEVAKSSVGGGAPGAMPTALPMAATQPGHPGATASANAPTIISSGGATPGGRAGTAVSLFGGASPSVASTTPNSYPGLSSAYASAANTYASTYSPAGSTANSGISTYGAGAPVNATRALRTDTTQSPQLSFDENHRLIEDSKPVINQFNQSRGIPPLPIPPTRFGQPLQQNAGAAR